MTQLPAADMAPPRQSELSPSGIITLLTDFGCADGYVAAMKGVMLGLFPAARLIDISHEVEPHNVAAGSFLLSAHYKYFPAGTVHVAVIDPGVGTGRLAISCASRGHFFVAPDNGLLDFCAMDPQHRAVVLSRRQYWRTEVSTTFHGRDIFAPVAAHLAQGVPLDEFGEPIALEVRHPASFSRFERGALIGEIIHIDHFGNLISNITKTDLELLGKEDELAVHVPGKGRIGLQVSYGFVSPGEPVAIINSFDRLELGVNQGNAAEALGLPTGTRIIVKKGE